jgi:hypothetical protein
VVVEKSDIGVYQYECHRPDAHPLLNQSIGSRRSALNSIATLKICVRAVSQLTTTSQRTSKSGCVEAAIRGTQSLRAIILV